jgi:hypothetical protein
VLPVSVLRTGRWQLFVSNRPLAEVDVAHWAAIAINLTPAITAILAQTRGSSQLNLDVVSGAVGVGRGEILTLVD